MKQTVLYPYCMNENEENPAASVAYWRNLIESRPDNYAAMNELGSALFYGIGIETDQEKAAEYFFTAAQSEDSEACYNLGICLLNGYGIAANIQGAIHYLTLASKEEELCNGKIYALIALGDLTAEGIYIPENKELACDYYMRAIRPFLSQEDYLDDEDFIIPDTRELLLKMAALGNKEALEHLHALDDSHEFLSDHQDILLKAISLGNKEAVALLEDKPEYFISEAENGNPEMMSAVAYLYNWGYFADDSHRYTEYFHFGKYDPETALTWWTKAAKAGNSASCYQLYQLNLKKNPEEAFEWLEAASNTGMLKAQYELGRRYLGEDDEKADYWLSKAILRNYMGLDDELLVEYYYDNIFECDDRNSDISDELIILWCLRCIEAHSFIADDAQAILKWLCTE